MSHNPRVFVYLPAKKFNDLAIGALELVQDIRDNEKGDNKRVSKRTLELANSLKVKLAKFGYYVIR